MHLPKLYARGARDHRIRYAIANILRDRVVNEGGFRNWFEMEDADEVVRAILRRGLKNPKLRTALERSHVVDFTQWLLLNPDLHEAYYSSNNIGRLHPTSRHRQRKRRTKSFSVK